MLWINIGTAYDWVCGRLGGGVISLFNHPPFLRYIASSVQKRPLPCYSLLNLSMLIPI
jgi:hypothetical protein